MKKIALVASILLIAGTAGAQNLLSNPGFETGDWTGWNVPNPGRTACSYNQPDQHSGSYCFCEEGCCGSFGELCAEQEVATDPGSSYDVGAWMKGCSPGNVTTQLYADGSVCGSLGSPFATDSTCSYTQYLTVVSGVSTVNLVLRSSGGPWNGNSAHFDDAQVIPQAVGDWVLY